ncbi:MAG TPA: class I SAM-dependent methyltransferase [Candidatus Angelobacter sp.]|nr:class I SAM-dependent methyltransferase [Candidatus Angelobacter sp.]
MPAPSRDHAEVDAAGGPTIRNISDTALWVAVYRARESERSDAVFHDPLARRLAGERGEQIARSMAFSEKNAWSYVARTWAVDQIVTHQVQSGADTVINLAAGLDTRPYRMELPPALKWIEVDLPGMIDYKGQALAGEKPRCALERVSLDLADVAARREVFADFGRKTKNALIITEGLLVYLSPEEVLQLGRDLGAQATFRDWIVEVISPGLLKMLQKNLGALGEAGSPLKFGPSEGPDFFTACGWKPAEVHPLLQTAARLKRLSLLMRLVAKLPASNEKQGSRPWGAVCRVTRV